MIYENRQKTTWTGMPTFFANPWMTFTAFTAAFLGFCHFFLDLELHYTAYWILNVFLFALIFQYIWRLFDVQIGFCQKPLTTFLEGFKISQVVSVSGPLWKWVINLQKNLENLCKNMFNDKTHMLFNFYNKLK